MAKLRPLSNVLCYSENKPPRSTIHRYYRLFRKENCMPDRCDILDCMFHNGELVWNGSALPLILDHIDGCSSNNCQANLRYLCPNCNEQQNRTRGGANKGRIQMRGPAGYAIVEKDSPDRHVKLFEEVDITDSATCVKVTPDGKEMSY